LLLEQAVFLDLPFEFLFRQALPFTGIMQDKVAAEGDMPDQ
jgi:hypothetical protein